MVGYSTGGGNHHPFTWEGGRLSPMPLPGAPGAVRSATALHVNDAGQVAGTLATSQGAYLFLKGGSGATYHPYQDTENPVTELTDLNERGDVLVAVRTYRSRYHGTYEAWAPSVMRNVRVPVHFHGQAIDEAGTVYGARYLTEASPEAAAFDGNSVNLLASGHSTASFVTAAGVVGGMSLERGSPTATLWRKGERTPLPRVRGSFMEQAWVGNDQGLVAGFALFGSWLGPRTPVLWREGAGVRIDDVVGGDWSVEWVGDGNERGQLVGWGRNRRTGARGALLLTPQ